MLTPATTGCIKGNGLAGKSGGPLGERHFSVAQGANPEIPELLSTVLDCSPVVPEELFIHFFGIL